MHVPNASIYHSCWQYTIMFSESKVLQTHMHLYFGEVGIDAPENVDFNSGSDKATENVSGGMLKDVVSQGEHTVPRPHRDALTWEGNEK